MDVPDPAPASPAATSIDHDASGSGGPDGTHLDRRIAVRLAVALALALALLHRGHFVTTDELGVYFQTRAIATRGDLAIPSIPNSWPGAGGRVYSQYTIGQSLLAVPLFALGRTIGAALPREARFALQGPAYHVLGYQSAADVEIWFLGLYAPIATAILALLFFRFERLLGASRGAALAASVVLALATHALVLSTLFLQHTTEGLAALGVFFFWYRFRTGGRSRDLAWGGVCAAALPHIRLAGIVSLPILGAYLAFVLWERRREGAWYAQLRRVAVCVLLPGLASAALYLVVNYVKWGSWLESPMAGQRSDLVAFSWERVVGLLASPGLGIVVYSPIVLLAPWMLACIARRQRGEVAAIVALSLATLVFYAHYQRWTGFWSAPGPRYLFVPTVFLLLALGPWLDAARRPVARLAVVALGLVGLAVGLVSASTEWSRIVAEQGYQQWQPEFGFVFDAAHAPVLAAARAFFDPEASGLWIVRLARGWPGFPAAPGAAMGIVSLWLAAVVAAVYWLAQALRETREKTPGSAVR